MVTSKSHFLHSSGLIVKRCQCSSTKIQQAAGDGTFPYDVIISSTGVKFLQGGAG